MVRLALSKHQQWLRGCFALALCCVVSSCGFQLRGSYQVPEQLNEVSLQAPVRSDFAARLVEAFQQHQIDVVEASEGITHIELLPDRLDRRVLSLLVTGQVAEYELIYTVPVRVYTQDGRVEQHNIQIFRDYQEDPNFALAKTRELELLTNEMRDDAVYRVMMLLTRLTWE